MWSPLRHLPFFPLPCSLHCSLSPIIIPPNDSCPLAHIAVTFNPPPYSSYVQFPVPRCALDTTWACPSVAPLLEACFSVWCWDPYQKGLWEALGSTGRMPWEGIVGLLSLFWLPVLVEWALTLICPLFFCGVLHGSYVCIPTWELHKLCILTS